MYKPDIRNVPLKVLEWGLQNNLEVVRTFLYLKFTHPSHFHYKDRFTIAKGLRVSERTLLRHLDILAKEKWVNKVGRGQSAVFYIRSFKYLHKIIGTPFQSKIEMDRKFLEKQYFTSWVFRSLVTRMVRYYEANKNIDEVSRNFLRSDGSKLRGIDISVRYLADSFGTSPAKIQRIKSIAVNQGAVIRVKNGMFISPDEIKSYLRQGYIVKKTDRGPEHHSGHYIPLPDTLLPAKAIDYYIDNDLPTAPLNKVFDDNQRQYVLWDIHQYSPKTFTKIRTDKYSVSVKERLRERCRKMIVDWFDGCHGFDVRERFEEFVADAMNRWSSANIEAAIDTLRNKDDGWQKLITVRPGIPWALFNFGGRWAISLHHSGMKDQTDFWVKPYCRTHWEALRAIDYAGFKKRVSFIDDWIQFDGDFIHRFYPDLDKSPLSDADRLEIWTRYSLDKPTLPQIQTLLSLARQAVSPTQHSMNTFENRVFGNDCIKSVIKAK